MDSPEARAAWLARRYAEASELLASVRDVVHERPSAGAAPSWSDRRGWTAFLDAFPDDAVLAAERDGLAAHLPSLPGAPASLAELARRVTDVVALPSLDAAPGAAVDGRRASPRKRAQVASLAALAARVAHGAGRVVDVGSGHGHLTRHLARALALPAEGWERDPARVAVAASLTPDGAARFVEADARALAVALAPSDVVVGLHACGELGDAAVRAAAGAGAAVAVVGCCLQKRPGDREPLASPPGGLTLGHAALGLGNARDGDEGVEADLATRTASRVHRVALGLCLREAGLALAPGEEMRGVNRRRATGAFEALAAAAFAARSLPVPSPRALERALREARDGYERTRRHALPRAMLARLVEAWVALDRAALLGRAGHDAEVLVAFDAAVSPRNVAVLGRRR